METNTKLSAPWITYYHEIEALFKNDPSVTTEFDEGDNVVKLYVEDEEKADALTELLPAEKTFGNVTLNVKVIPTNRLGATKASLFRKAFEGNAAFAFTQTFTGILSNPLTYVVFKKEVVQFWNDDLGDLNGLESTLYEDIARNVFGDVDGVCFCTATGGTDQTNFNKEIYTGVLLKGKKN